MDYRKYYKEQLERIRTDLEYESTFIFKDEDDNKTNTLNLNKDSAKELIIWLNHRFFKKGGENE